MSTLSVLLNVFHLLLTPVVITGLLVRRSYKLCISLLLYLPLVWLGDLLMLVQPRRFWNWEFVTLKETIYLGLKLAVAFEVSRRMFAAFPGALALAQRTQLLACTVLLGILVSNWPTPAGHISRIWISLGPWAQNCTGALFILLWCLIIWYGIPTHPIHRGIVRGFSMYLLTNAISLAVTARISGSSSVLRTISTAIPWMMLIAYWSWVVWRPHPVSQRMRRVTTAVHIA